MLFSHLKIMSNVMCSSGISFQLLFEVTSVGESSSVVTVLHFPWKPAFTYLSDFMLSAKQMSQ
jgi:hypothetical protein